MKRKCIANIARLHALMDEAKLDALVLRSGVVYLGTLQESSRTKAPKGW
jgi:hypothetical protein